MSRSVLNMTLELFGDTLSLKEFLTTYQNKCTMKTRTGCDTANLFAKHFALLYSEQSKTSYIPDFPQSGCSISPFAISEADVESKIKSVDTAKVAGSDGIPPHFIKKTVVLYYPSFAVSHLIKVSALVTFPNYRS